jgi:hypothetical protein
MNCFPLFVAGTDTQKPGPILLKQSALQLAIEHLSKLTDRWKIKNTASQIIRLIDSYSIGSFPEVKRPEREAGQKLHLLRS